MTTAELDLRERQGWETPDTDFAEISVRPWRAKVLKPMAAASLIAADITIVAGAFLLAYAARFSVDESLPAQGLNDYIGLALLIGGLTAALLSTHQLYDLERPQSWPVRVRSIASSISIALVLAIAGSFFLGEQAFSRLWLATGWSTAIAVLGVWRTVAQRVYARVRDALMPSKRVLIVGANRLGRQVAYEMMGSYRVLGYVDNGSDLEQLEVPLLGPISRLDELIQTCAVDELVIALPTHRREQVRHLLARGFRRQVHVKLLPEFDELIPERFELQQVGGRYYIGFVPVASVTWAKRALDLALVSVGLLLISPLLLAIAIAIKLDSPGPVLYRQERMGKHGRLFSMCKFRSMCADADRQLEELQAHNEATGPLFKMRNDPRVTRVGWFLRRWSLDELPQLFNVLTGAMSLVGPRPPLPSEVAKYEEWQIGRLRALPGLTGLWQVSGRSEVPFNDMVRLDLHYIRNWSFGLDLEILLRTIPAVLTNRGAY